MFPKFNVDYGDLQILFPLRSIFIGMPLIMLLYVLTAVSYIAVLPVAQYDWAGSGQNAAVILFLAPQRGGGVGYPLAGSLG